jgi:ubiquitin C-terminal hydrolase
MSISGVAECETDKLALCCYEMIKKTYSDEYSEIWNLFYAVHVSEIISIETGARLSVRPEPFFIVSLPIPANNKNPTILDCFNLYVEGEKLDGDNAWFHEETNKKVDIIKKLSFWSLPSILVIDFKRFNSMNQKNQILITFPVNQVLDLSNYVIGYKKETYLYELYGVCNHVGGALGGHYFAFIKNANGKWYTFNDVSVVEVSDAQIVSPKAYCLFYRIKHI